MKFTAPANSAKMEERPRGFYSAVRRSIDAPIGTHLFLLIAKLRDGATVNMTDGCATMGSLLAPSEQTSPTDEPRKSPDAKRCDATARFRG